VDVNVGTGVGSRENEIDSMKWAVTELKSAVEAPLCVDSADPQVLEAGLAAIGSDTALINSAKAEQGMLEEVVQLAAQFGCPLVGLAMDETGIPPTQEGRIAACGKIAAACESLSVPLERVFFDPLVLPVSTDIKQGLVTLATITAIKARFPGVRTVMGLSNISFGLPGRARLNAAFLHMAAYAGLDAAIADPLDEELMAAIKTAEVLIGKDRHCRKYTRAFRKA
jgi:5-methyltetrahydrofolate--homocysteine methyltransferase